MHEQPKQSLTPAATGFCRTRARRKSEIRHTLRILLEEPRGIPETNQEQRRVELLSTMGESEEEIREAIKRMHAQEESKSRPAKIAYLEILCYPKDYPERKEDLIAYMRKLEQRYNTRVYAVVHLKELHPHAYLIIRWKDNKGKCLRLRKGDMWQLWREVIREVNGREIMPDCARKQLKVLLYARSTNNTERYLEIRDYARKYSNAYNRFCELYREALKRGISFDWVFLQSPLKVGRKKALWLFEHVLKNNIPIKEIFPPEFSQEHEEAIEELERALDEVRNIRENYMSSALSKAKLPEP